MMNKKPDRLVWDGTRQDYVVLGTAPGAQPHPIRIGSEEWLTWLGERTSFAFEGQHGNYTAQRDKKHYWKAHRHWKEGSFSWYLGRSSDLTAALLEEAVRALDRKVRPSPGIAASLAGASLLGAAGSGSGEVDAMQDRRLHLPPLPAQLEGSQHLVQRPSLVEQIQKGMAWPVTLLVGPPGSGKSTSLALWHQQYPVPLAYFALEEFDNHPLRFLTGIIHALQQIDPAIGQDALVRRRNLEPVEEEVLELLLYDLQTRNGPPSVLLLDDYHRVADPAIRSLVEYLVKHRPASLHLFIASREVPRLPLANWEAKNWLYRVSDHTLPFDLSEAAGYVREVMQVSLTDAQLMLLLQRTEGHIYMIKMAAQYFQIQPDISRVLETLGTHHKVQDYLSEQVFDHLSEEVRAFLLQTAILEQFCGPLCDALTGREGSQRILEQVEKARLFLIPLDEVRGWYRYHHLFAEFLRSRLEAEMPGRLPALHSRASRWFEQQDLLLEAFHHARQTKEPELPARLVAQHMYTLAFRGKAELVMGVLPEVLAWLETLEPEQFQRHPYLFLSRILLLVLTGQYGVALRYLHIAKQVIPSLIEEGRQQQVLYEVESFFAFIYVLQGDMKRGVELAVEVCQWPVQADKLPMDTTRHFAAHQPLVTGDVQERDPRQSLIPAPVKATSGDGYLMDGLMHLTSFMLQANLYRMQGKFRQAIATLEQMLLVQQRYQILLTHPGASFGLGELYYARNELERAQPWLEQGMTLLNSPLTLAGTLTLRGYATLARLYQARHQPSKAKQIMDDFERLARVRQFAPQVLKEVQAHRAWLAFRQNRPQAAFDWASTCGLTTEDVPDYLREQEHLVFARVRIRKAQEGKLLLSKVIGLLERLRQDAQEKAREGSLLEIVVVLALAHNANDHRCLNTIVVPLLTQALEIARREGVMRVFLDEGRAMETLMRRMLEFLEEEKQEDHPTFPYLKRILAAFAEEAGDEHMRRIMAGDPLENREVEVLRLFSKGGMTSKKVGEYMGIEESTVRRHLANIYTKLDVHDRIAALRKAGELGLL